MRTRFSLFWEKEASWTTLPSPSFGGPLPSAAVAFRLQNAASHWQSGDSHVKRLERTVAIRSRRHPARLTHQHLRSGHRFSFRRNLLVTPLQLSGRSWP